MKKNYTFIFFVCIGIFGAFSQDWETDLGLAKNLASSENKNIVLVFQGSDWCGPCIKLDREVWSTPDFIEYAENNFVMLKADFPKKKKNLLSNNQQIKNKELAQKYNPKGYFPLVVVLNANEKILGKIGYKKGTPKEYILLLESFKE